MVMENAIFFSSTKDPIQFICYGMTILERQTHFLLQTWGLFLGVSTVKSIMELAYIIYLFDLQISMVCIIICSLAY